MTVARTLPGRYYADPAVFALEQGRIFGEMWVCVGRAEEVGRRGTFVCKTIAGESVIVARDRGGQLRAFHNVCRHRGTPVCTVPRGEASSFRCPYHAWTYGLDGHLLGAPMLGELRAHGFDVDDAALAPVAVESWEGLLWLSLHPAPSAVANQAAPALADLARFARYRLGDLRIGKTIEYQVAANWKLLVENFMECTHCAPMHPELCRAVPDFRSGLTSQERGAELAGEFQAFTVTGKASRPRLPGLLEEDSHRVRALVLLPNILMLLTPDHVVVLLLLPRGTDRTEVRCDWLFDPGAVANPAFDPGDAVELFDTVNRQDWRVMELTQQSMSSRAWRRGGVLAPAERQIAAFNQFVLARLGDSP
jgi:Rieske 2Fe-2S family protein